MSLETIVFGDPHCNYTAIEEAALDIDPANPPLCIFVGDFGFGDTVGNKKTHDAVLLDPRPADEILRPLTDLGCQILYVMGNHDFENERQYSKFLESRTLRTGNLHRRVIEVDGVRIAGLGGIFAGHVWEPNLWDLGLPESLKFHTRAQYALEKKSKWKDGLAIPHRQIIFPEDIEYMRTLEADILVMHEAPFSDETDDKGHHVLNRLAEEMGVKAIIHGHLHWAYKTELESGIVVHGRGKSDSFKLDLGGFRNDCGYSR